jgi:AcrR family transcriptional regulator
MARPRKSEARDTRRALLDASLELFSQKGFFGTTTRDIARAVGVRESALYHHFPSKEAVLTALIEEMGPGKAHRLDQLDLVGLAQAMGVEAVLRQLMNTAVSEWSSPREVKFFRLMMSEGLRFKDSGLFDLRKNVAYARGRIAEVFAKLSAAGLVRPLEPETMALAFIGPLVVIRLQHLGSGAPDFKALAVELERHFSHFFRTVQLQSERSLNSPTPRRPRGRPAQARRS